MEFDGTDRPADMIDSLFDDSDPILFEVEHGVAPFANDSTLAQMMIQHFLIGKELNPHEEVAFGVAMQTAPSRKGFPHVQETIEIVSLFDGMVSLFEELSTDSSGNSTGPVARDVMMGFRGDDRISS